MRHVIHYSISEVVPYVNWAYFFHAWQMAGKPQSEQDALRGDAERLLDHWKDNYHTHAVVGIYPAGSDSDDIVVEGVRLPMLRQQIPDKERGVCLCLADFVRPLSPKPLDKVGVFAVTIDSIVETLYVDDPYLRMLAQTLADRLAEASAELLHLQVRTRIWGYAPDEKLDIEQLHAEAFQGIRPAVGYPSLPDTSLNFLLDQLIDMGEIGIRLTENGAMRPHASVSGLMLQHAAARYFYLGKIGEDQWADYARRRGIPLEMARKFLASNMIKTN